MGDNMNMNIRGRVAAALIATLMVLAGCSSDSPTAPTSGGGSGGTTTPPTGASVTLTVSNANPVISSTSTITATVTDNNQPVPNGTAVEFSTDFGTFTDTAAATTIRTTTGGSATAVLTSPTVGSAIVTVRVNNVVKTTSVVFKQQTTGGGTLPTISSFTPSGSKPSGGSVVTITGSNFTDPVRVLFGTKPATIVSSTSTQIQVVVPGIDLGATEQQRTVKITVISQAGTASEQTATSTGSFTYQIEILSPVIYTISPASGPNEGSTRITIIGEGFQAPTRVFFGTAGAAGANLTDQVEARVEQVSFGQIIATTPPATGLGAELRDKQVVVRVLNVNSNKDAVLINAFRYGPRMQITAVSNNDQPYFGGGKVTIYGWGFDDPVAVSFAGIAAQVIKVSGTEIVAIASPARIIGCADVSGPIVVTNIEDGSSSTAGTIQPTFVYRAIKPVIVAVSPNPSTVGSQVAVTVGGGTLGTLRFKVDSTNVLSTFLLTNSDGTSTYQITIPAITFDTQVCGGGTGIQQVPKIVTLAVDNTTTGCSDNVSITVNPTNGSCVIPPKATVSPSSADFGSVVAAGANTSSRNFIVTNTAPAGGSDLIVSAVTSSNPAFTVTGPIPATIPAGSSTSYTVTFDPSAVGPAAGSITFNTNDPTTPTSTVTVSGTGT